MKDLDYTIWFLPRENNVFTPFWSLRTKTAKARVPFEDAPDMYGPGTHCFTLMKMKHPEVSEPVRKRDIVEIFGRDGDIDLYEKLINKPIFERREIKEQFLLLGQNAESGNYYVGDHREWAMMISQIKNFFNSHRKQMRVVLSDDPGYYWQGRFTAAIDELEPFRAILTVTADVEPYKYERYDSSGPWLWDDFSFIDGIIRDYGDISVENDPVTHDMVFSICVRLRDSVPLFMAKGENVQVGDVQVSQNRRDWYDVPVGTPGLPTAGGNTYQIQLEGSQVVTPRYLYFRKTVDADRTVLISMRGATL